MSRQESNPLETHVPPALIAIQEEDFLKARNMLKTINDYFLPLIPSQ